MTTPVPTSTGAKEPKPFFKPENNILMLAKGDTLRNKKFLVFV
jgi:hypothetical protein